MSPAHRLTALAAVLLSMSAAPQAQNLPRYTMTTLAIPVGASHSTAFTLDAAGNARGSINTDTAYTTLCGGASGTFWDTLLLRSCTATRYSTQEALWPASTALQQAATLGSSDFVTVGTSSNGTLVGVRGTYVGKEIGLWDRTVFNASALYGYNSRTESITPWRVAQVINQANADIGTSNKSIVLKTGTTISSVPFTASTGLRLGATRTWYTQVRGISGTGVVLVNATNDLSSVPYLLTNGRYTRLNDSLAPGQLLGTAMNDAGAVVGVRWVTRLDTDLADPLVPVRWQNGVAVELGGPELRGYIPEAVNPSGQMLLHKVTRPSGRDFHQAAVWFNGALTPLVAPPDDGTQGKDPYGNPYGVVPMALNSKGHVAGCGVFPFVWRDGVMINLNQVLAAQGLRTPNGNPLSCVTAINDQGVILANYPLSTPQKAQAGYGWVRMAPLP